MSGRSDLPARDFQTRRESIRARLHAQLVPLVAFDVQQPRVVRIERLAVDVDRRRRSQREFGSGCEAAGGARRHVQTRAPATVDWRVRSASCVDMTSLTFHFMESDERFKSVFGKVSHRTPTVLATDVSVDYGPERTHQ